MSEYIYTDENMPEGACEMMRIFYRREEIIRCRDCKLFDDHYLKCFRPVLYFDHDCNPHWTDETNFTAVTDATPDGFCAWACRKEQREQLNVPSNDNLRHESVVSAGQGGSNETFDAQDSRERLEEDARDLQSRIWDAGSRHDGISLSHIIDLLDRQAAITERESHRRIDDLSRDCEMWRDRSEDMRMERDDLARKLEIAEKHEQGRDSECEQCMAGHDETIAGLARERDELQDMLEAAQNRNRDLQAQVDDLADERDLFRSMVENDGLRKEFTDRLYAEMCNAYLKAVLYGIDGDGDDDDGESEDPCCSAPSGEER